jgi:chorismate mutase
MQDGNFYIVNKKILPEVLKKTVDVKELLINNEKITVNEAVAQIGMSRSAFYKYKDHIAPFFMVEKTKIITVNLILMHRLGVLASVLDYVSKNIGNILTINQGLPLQAQAAVTLSAEVEFDQLNLDHMIEYLRQMDGVCKVELVSQS